MTAQEMRVHAPDVSPATPNWCLACHDLPAQGKVGRVTSIRSPGAG